MENRVILLIDSSSGEEFHYHSCINVPSDLLGDIVAIDKNDFASFERFYFSHKDRVEMQFLIVDMVYVWFMSLFRELMQPKNPGENDLLNRVLDNEYAAHMKDDILELLNNPNTDNILIYLDSIQQGLSVDEDDMSQLRLVSRCVDVKNAVMQGLDLSSTGLGLDDEDVFVLGLRKMKDVVKVWAEKAENYQVFGDVNYHPEEFDGFGVKIVHDDSEWRNALDLLRCSSEYIKSVMAQAIYNEREMSKEDRRRFLELWPFVVSIDFNTVVPKSFFDAARKMLNV